jgi:hypothetical protein
MGPDSGQIRDCRHAHRCGPMIGAAPQQIIALSGGRSHAASVTKRLAGAWETFAASCPPLSQILSRGG